MTAFYYWLCGPCLGRFPGRAKQGAWDVAHVLAHQTFIDLDLGHPDTGKSTRRARRR